MEDAELVDSSYETEAQVKAPRTTYYMAERTRSAHETEVKVMGELINEEVDFGGDEEATGTRIPFNNMEAEAHANALLEWMPSARQRLALGE